MKLCYTRGKDFTELQSVKLAIESPFRYAGEWVDEKTNLQYLRARWYDAKLGRFISEDPVEGIFTEPLSLNRYTYAENNPLKYVDPSGNIVGTLIDIGFLIYDTAKFIKEPSKANAKDVGLSLAFALTPGLTGGSAAAKAVAKGIGKGEQILDKVSGNGWIKHDTYNEIRNKFGKDGVDKFTDAMKKGFVSGQGENGIKLLSGNGVKVGGTYYKYEIKVKGKYGDWRVYGNYDEKTNQIIFGKFDKGKH